MNGQGEYENSNNADFQPDHLNNLNGTTHKYSTDTELKHIKQESEREKDNKVNLDDIKVTLTNDENNENKKNENDDGNQRENSDNKPSTNLNQIKVEEIQETRKHERSKSVKDTNVNENINGISKKKGPSTRSKTKKQLNFNIEDLEKLVSSAPDTNKYRSTKDLTKKAEVDDKEDNLDNHPNHLFNVLTVTNEQIDNQKGDKSSRHIKAYSEASSNPEIDNDSKIVSTFVLKLNKFKFQQKVMEEFDNVFKIESPILYKDGLFFHEYTLVVRKNKVILLDNKANRTSIIPEIKEKSPFVILDFDYVSVVLTKDTNNHSFTLNIIGTKKSFIFKLKYKNDTLFSSIISFINYFISQSKGHKEILLNTVLRGDMFYKSYFMYESELTTQAKTGDILIFRGYECGSKLQRSLTCEQYGK